MTVDIKETVDTDATYIFNTNRHFPYKAQYLIYTKTLEWLNTSDAAATYPPSQLVYLRKVWAEVGKRVEAKHAAEVTDE